MSDWNNNMSDWNSIGHYYGYPDCCIKQFINMLKNNKFPNDDQKKVSKHKGFIPCDFHTKQILENKIKLEDLIQNRICKKKF